MKYEQREGVRYAEQEAFAASFITTVAKDLQSGLSSKRQEEIADAVGIATQMAGKLQLHPEVCNPTSPDEWERGALLLGMAAQWKDAASTPMVSQRDVAKWLGLLYRDDERDAKVYLPYVHDEYASHYDVFQEVFRRVWRQSKGDFNWVRENKAVDGLVTLPFVNSMTSKGRWFPVLLQRIYQQKGLLSHADFEAVAFQEYGFAVVFEDTDERTREHERVHVNNEGLLIVGFGNSLNEGRTDLLALEKVPQAKKPQNYQDERRLVQGLMDNPTVGQALAERYQNISMDTSYALATQLIQAYGLQNYMLLYAAHANVVSENDIKRFRNQPIGQSYLADRTAFKKLYGLVATDDVRKRLQLP